MCPRQGHVTQAHIHAIASVKLPKGYPFPITSLRNRLSAKDRGLIAPKK